MLANDNRSLGPVGSRLDSVPQLSWPDHSPVPKSFICPLTKRLMKQPVVDREGNSYEKDAILGHLQVTGFSPVTENPLQASDLVENRGLQMAIQAVLIQERKRSAKRKKVRRFQKSLSSSAHSLSSTALSLSSSMKEAMHILPRRRKGRGKSDGEQHDADGKECDVPGEFFSGCEEKEESIQSSYVQDCSLKKMRSGVMATDDEALDAIDDELASLTSFADSGEVEEEIQGRDHRLLNADVNFDTPNPNTRQASHNHPPATRSQSDAATTATISTPVILKDSLQVLYPRSVNESRLGSGEAEEWNQYGEGLIPIRNSLKRSILTEEYDGTQGAALCSSPDTNLVLHQQTKAGVQDVMVANSNGNDPATNQAGSPRREDKLTKESFEEKPSDMMPPSADEMVSAEERFEESLRRKLSEGSCCSKRLNQRKKETEFAKQLLEEITLSEPDEAVPLHQTKVGMHNLMTDSLNGKDPATHQGSFSRSENKTAKENLEEKLRRKLADSSLGSERCKQRNNTTKYIKQPLAMIAPSANGVVGAEERFEERLRRKLSEGSRRSARFNRRNKEREPAKQLLGETTPSENYEVAPKMEDMYERNRSHESTCETIVYNLVEANSNGEDPATKQGSSSRRENKTAKESLEEKVRRKLADGSLGSARLNQGNKSTKSAKKPLEMTMAPIKNGVVRAEERFEERLRRKMSEASCRSARLNKEGKETELTTKLLEETTPSTNDVVTCGKEEMSGKNRQNDLTRETLSDCYTDLANYVCTFEKKLLRKMSADDGCKTKSKKQPWARATVACPVTTDLNTSESSCEFESRYERVGKGKDRRASLYEGLDSILARRRSNQFDGSRKAPSVSELKACNGLSQFGVKSRNDPDWFQLQRERAENYKDRRASLYEGLDPILARRLSAAVNDEEPRWCAAAHDKKHAGKQLVMGPKDDDDNWLNWLRASSEDIHSNERQGGT